MEIGYIGGIVRSEAVQIDPKTGWQAWRWTHNERESFLFAGGAGCRLFARFDVAILLRGFVTDTWSRQPHDLDLLASKLLRVYRQEGSLHIDGLEGSFSLALVDGKAGKVLLYRNLVGDSNSYYRETSSGVLFGSNLADLIEASGESPRPNHEELPTFFLNRTVPGRNTLFAGYHRLFPGEQLQAKDGKTSVVHRRTLGDLREPRPVGKDALERLEATIGRIFQDYQSAEPETINLLSGGVDSSFLQVHWNRVCAEKTQPKSYCVSVNHPRTQGDRDYAVSAAQRLGVVHQFLPADESYADYLHETLDATGEMHSHVQLAYFLRFGNQLSTHGVKAAILGEGADSLFGTSLATALQSASLVRRMLPLKFLRRGAARLARWLRRERVGGYFDLAEYLHDYERLEHPVNKIAVFADWPAVEACFGKQAVAEAAASRRALLDEYHVPASPLDRTHYAGVLGSSIHISAVVTTLFARSGVRTFTPFYDSRMLRLVVNLSPRQRFRFRQPKSLLKRSLERHGFAELAQRSKKSFGQPIFEWLAPGGQLAPLVDQIDDYPFIDRSALRGQREKPTWFLYNLLCYDRWYKRWIGGRRAT